MSNSLEKIKSHNTIIVGDSGDIDLIRKVKPEDATTNPTLIFNAISKEEQKYFIDNALKYVKSKNMDISDEGQKDLILDKISVDLGNEILKHIPGKVSTEVDAKLSFSTEKTINKAKQIIRLYEEIGIDKNRVLIKIGATWEGIKAAEILQSEGINCNLTLIFSLIQAISCAQHNIYLLSPFVGRVLDWQKKNTTIDQNRFNHPGILLVKDIHNQYKKHKHTTIVMAASFRTVEECIELSGVDRQTIPPVVIDKLIKDTENFERKLDENYVDVDYIDGRDENVFRWMLNEDAMATEKLAEGIRGFANDSKKLGLLIDSILSKV